DNTLATTERDNMFSFVVERGTQAREGVAYTHQMRHADEQQIRSFDQNARALASQIRTYNISILDGWRSEIVTLITQQRDDQTRRNLEGLQRDLDTLLTRLRGNQQVADDDLRSATQRFFLLTGRSGPSSTADRLETLRTAATELRGTARSIREFSPEWF